MKKLLISLIGIISISDMYAAGMLYKAGGYTDSGKDVPARVVSREFQNSLAHRFAMDYIAKLQDGIPLENMNSEQFDKDLINKIGQVRPRTND